MSFGCGVTASTVTYTPQDFNLNQVRTAGGGARGIFNSSGTQIGVYANGAADASVAGFQTFTTDGVGSGTARSLQVGDTFTITCKVNANPVNRLGISFRSSTDYSTFSNAEDSASRARFEINSSGGWKIRSNSENTDSGLGTVNADVTFTLKVTSSNTFTATVIRNASTYNRFDRTMLAGSGPLSSFAIYLVDGGFSNDAFWKSGALSDTGAVHFGADDGNRTISGLISNGLDAGSTSTVRVNSVTKQGSGSIEFSNTNTYTGVTTLSGGTLSVTTIGNGGASGNLGAASSDSANLVFDGGALRYIGGTASTDRGATVYSGKDATIRVSSATLTISGAIVSNAMAGGALIKTGPGSLILSSISNSYTGTGSNTLAAGGTQISEGLLGIHADTSLGIAPQSAYNNIQFTGSGTLQGASTGITLHANRNISVAGGATGTLDSNGNTFTINGNVVGSGSLSKSGAGAVVLVGLSNSYSGATSVSSGALLVEGIKSGGGAITVNGSTAVLGGGENSASGNSVAGDITLTASSGATLTGGDIGTAGKFVGTGNFTLNTGTSLQVDIGAPTTAGVTFDQIALTGTGRSINLNNANLIINIIGAVQAATYRIIDATGGSGNTRTNLFSGIVGNTEYTLAGTGNAVKYKVLYGTNFVDLTFTAVPEPTSFGLLAGALGLMVARRNRTK